MSKSLELTIDKNGVGTLMFDVPNASVNALSDRVMEEFDRVLGELAGKTELKALMIKSAKDSYVAGIDLDELQDITDVEAGRKKAALGQQVFAKLENLPFPTIAVINGACVGGGLELALACSYRIASDAEKASIGLPEVSLGLIPAWGGCQRLPDLIGLQKALGIILAGKVMDARRAYKMKIIDKVVAAEFLEEEADAFVEQILDRKARKKILGRRGSKGIMAALLEKNPLGRTLVFNRARSTVMQKTKGQYPAPLMALEVIRDTRGASVAKCIRRESGEIVKLIGGGITANLVNLYLTNQRLKKEGWGAEKSKKRKISKVGVLGAGVMGGGIAWLFANRGYPTYIKDLQWDAVAKGYQTASDYFGQMVKYRKMTPGQKNVKMHHIHGSTDYKGFGKLDLVVEAVVEDINVKKAVFAELEEVLSPETIICSNTSSLPIADMCADMKHPERFIGLHFFNPVNRMPLVEVIPGEKTDPAVVATMVDLMRKLKKTPVVVSDCAGFLVNRVVITCMNEAVRLFEEGESFTAVDKVFEEFGMPMGPFVLVDEVGIDVALKVAKRLEQAYGERMKVPTFLDKMVANNWNGRKSKKGFYIHSKSGRVVNAEAEALSEHRGRGGLDEQTIRQRLVYIMLNEAARCLEESVIHDPAYLDMSLIMGTGFPPFRGGLLRYADKLGIGSIVDGMNSLTDHYGERFSPCDKLISMAKSNELFFK
jgi:3-hydroxyacyl-CoA dehydrogenase/enoyl-CoA hydratase/3-hydroxybutyryl-CoA epimerase